MVEGTRPDASARPAELGDEISLRFDGDVEHRTYSLTAGIRGETSHTPLPVAWPLGSAVLSGAPGENRSYTRPDGTEQHVTIVAVWKPTGKSHQLPVDQNEAAPAGR